MKNNIARPKLYIIKMYNIQTQCYKVLEEAHEVISAALKHKYNNGSVEELLKELIHVQTAAETAKRIIADDSLINAAENEVLNDMEIRYSK
jgi:phosphoribosyl-ATP pyrophosphohydrolase